MMKKTILIIFFLIGRFIIINAQSNIIENILQEVEQNNILLQSARQELNADRLENNAENNLPDPSVTYSHLYNSKDKNLQQSELTVAQSFEFPTTYIARKQENNLKKESLQKQYEIIRRDVLLKAYQLCLDIISLNKQALLLKYLSENADTLVSIYEKRFHLGDANILEVNRIKMERMSLQTALADNNAAHRTTLQSLLAMNGNKPLMLYMIDFPTLSPLPPYEVLCDEILPINKEMEQGKAENATALKKISVNRMGWLPKLEIGYKRNNSPNEKFNGLMIGGSLPIFGNHNKVKAARARQLSTELKLQEVAQNVEAALQSRYNEAIQLQRVMATYDLELIEETFILLGKALNGGELSLSDYLIEMEAVVKQKQSYIELEKRYHKLMAQIYADKM